MRALAHILLDVPQVNTILGFLMCPLTICETTVRKWDSAPVGEEAPGRAPLDSRHTFDATPFW